MQLQKQQQQICKQELELNYLTEIHKLKQNQQRVMENMGSALDLIKNIRAKIA